MFIRRYKECSIWRRNRLAARIIMKSRTKPLNARDLRLARWLANHSNIENYLLDQGIASLIGRRGTRHARWAGGKGPLD